MMSFIKLAKKQNITKSSVTNAAAVIKRKTDDAIKRFKFLEPYYSRVFAMIYNFRLHGVPCGGEVVYWLVPRKARGRDIMQTPESEADKRSFERLFEKMGKDVEAIENLMDSDDYMEVLDCMMKRGKKKGGNLE